jgi:cytochrome c oxidase assembly protein subunit 15
VKKPRVPTIRLLSYSALVLTYLQTVFGAIVRITGSGLGCGEEWPRCRPAGSTRAYWIPPLERPDLIIEVTHRYLALAVALAVLGLYAATLAPRQEVPASQRQHQQRWSLRAVMLVALAAVLGRQTVKLGLSPIVVTTHLALALLLLGTLSYMVITTGGFDSAPRGTETQIDERTVSPRTRRAALAAAGMAFVVPVFGGLTATLPAAATACLGFPHCRTVAASGSPLAIHLTHRILAFLLVFHLIALAITVRRRNEPPPIRHAAWSCAGLVIAQLFIAAAMVEMAFPQSLRSMHQAIGVLVWVGTFSFAALCAKRTPSISART